MNSNKIPTLTPIAATLLAALLAGCSSETRPGPPEPEPEPAVAPSPAPAADSPGAVPEPDPTPAPDAMPPDAAPPGETAPPPSDPSATAKPTAAHVPALDSMRLAKASGKLGVAADVRFSFDAVPAPGQPVTLNIAVVPRVAGQSLEFSVQPVDGVSVAAGPVTRLKVDQADTLRQQYSITRTTATARALRVLVTHEWDGGSAFGFYSIPFD
jgi:hypothetical protein